jgi:hypothetical protein
MVLPSARARRTASARNSGGYGEWLFGIGVSHRALNAPTLRVSTEPGQLQRSGGDCGAAGRGGEGRATGRIDQGGDEPALGKAIAERTRRTDIGKRPEAFARAWRSEAEKAEGKSSLLKTMRGNALEMALHARGAALPNLVDHSDRGVQ